MKIKLLISFFSIVLLTLVSVDTAHGLTVTNPLTNNCYSSGQIITVSWSKSTAASAKHYAVTYRTDNSSPPTWEQNPSAWKIGHGLSTTSIGWKIPTLESTNVRVWVETHRNNHTSLEIVSSGKFSIKANCSTSTSPPSNPPPTNPPAAVKPPLVAKPSVASRSSEATPSSTLKRVEPKVEPPTVQEKEIVRRNSNYLRAFGVIYLGLFTAFFAGAAFFLFRKFKSLKLPLLAISKPKAVLKPKVAGKQKNQSEDLTLDELENLREEQGFPQTQEK